MRAALDSPPVRSKFPRLRRLLEILGLLVVWPAFGAPECPRIGAIRWDAWYGGTDAVGVAVETAMGPQRYHGRLPSCASVISPTEVRIDCANESAMERDIEAARAARLDYWAFVMYDPDINLSRALRLYLASPNKRHVNFSLIWAAPQLGKRADFPRVRERIVSLMSDPAYQKVLDGRPLFFFGFITEEYVQEAWGGDEGLRAALAELRDAARSAGLGNPYLVLMAYPARRAEELRKRFGFDAVSAYAVQQNDLRAPYATLTRHARRFWDGARKQSGKVVPTVMSGWDRRPMAQNRVPWEKRPEPADTMERYYETPSPAQIAGHLEDAVHWVWSHPTAAEANAVIIYAWNEHMEGGWLAPTLAEGEARVKVVGERMAVLCGSRG